MSSILFVGRSIPAHGRAGGMEASAWAVASYLARSTDVTFLTTRVPGRPKAFLEGAVRVHTVPGRSGRYSILWWICSAIVGRRLRPTCLFGVGGGATAVLLLSRRCASLIQAHGTSRTEASAAFRTRSLRSWIRGARMSMWIMIDTAAFARATRVLPVSEKVRTDLLAFPYRTVLKTRLGDPIPNGIDVDRFGTPLLSRVRLRHHYLPSGALCRKVVLFLGRVTHQKGLDLLIRALQEDPRGDYHLLVAGDGPQLHESRVLAAHLHASGATFLGVVEADAVPDVMAASDVLVFPVRTAEREGLPLTVLEAMASGLPVVSPEEMRWPSDVGKHIVSYGSTVEKSLLDAIEEAFDKSKVSRSSYLPSRYHSAETLEKYRVLVERTMKNTLSDQSS